MKAPHSRKNSPSSISRKTNIPSKHTQAPIDFIYDPTSHQPITYSRASLLTINKKIRRKVVIALLLSIVLVLVYFGLQYLHLSKIIAKSNVAAAPVLSQKLDFSSLSREDDSRVNILLLGVGDQTHAGANLSDTMAVLSIDPYTYDTTIVGLPRDLYVNIKGFGYDKINSAHAYGSQSDQPNSGPNLAKETVASTLGVDIHYFVRTDFSGLKEIVDSIGGVEIDVEQTLTDSEYPCKNNESRSCGITINAGKQTMTGEVALAYTRCRKGNCGNDFGRAARAQQLLVAVASKTSKNQTIFNPSKLTELIKSLSNHVRTDVGLGEIKKFYDIMSKINLNTINQVVLDNKQNNLVTTTTINGTSVVVPQAGDNDFSEIKRYVKTLFYNGRLRRENARLIVKNATADKKKTQLICDQLKDLSYNVVDCIDLGSVENTKVEGGDAANQPYTLQYLRKRFNVKPQASNNSSTTDIITVTVGADYKGI